MVSSGQNIYPEEVEEKINSSPYVSESLAIEDNHKVVALIVPNFEVLQSEGIATDQLTEFFEKIVREINTKLPVYSKISSFQIRNEEFEKTPKRSIKRFKYQK